MLIEGAECRWEVSGQKREDVDRLLEKMQNERIVVVLFSSPDVVG